MFTLNGFGTTFVGECDYDPDGTYITTAWIVALWIPLIPLYSARILSVEPTMLSGQYRITVLHLGILLLLAVAVCRLVWWRWHGKRTGPREFMRLEEEGIRYCLSGAGEGFVAYEWLQFVNLRGEIFPANCYCNTACRNRPA